MKTTNIGFPNVYGSLIKKAVEGYWLKEKTIEDILNSERGVCTYNISAQQKLDLQQVFDFDIYDRMLRTAVIFGFVPKRFGTAQNANDNLEEYLSIPRGSTKATASPMVKWFNTNYHVVQPEIENEPLLVSNPRIPDFKGFTFHSKFALIGPWTLLSYAINKTNLSKVLLFEKLIEQYIIFINSLPFQIIQLEEPSFLGDGIPNNYDRLLKRLDKEIHLHVYFGSVNSFADRLFKMPVDGIGLDFVDGNANLNVLDKFPSDKKLIAGIINGRNVWSVSTKTNRILDRIQEKISDDKLYISPSCSLMHVPLTSKAEKGAAAEFAFAIEKLDELQAIKDGTIKYRQVDERHPDLPTEKYTRSRKTFWISEIPYPTTTIGSFPQTSELRKVRKDWNDAKLSNEQYEIFIKKYIQNCVSIQEELGLDVLVHGEFERPDMVEYFAEHLEGYITIKGNVQSYGTRLVRPPVITGPLKRPSPMTIKWIQYAQSLTKRPMKGILTGPVTMVQWSFPREDVAREFQYYDIANILAQEIDDLVKAGIKHIQIDEPALREGLPVDPSAREHYTTHAINAFRRTYKDVPEDVVIHSHMCFSNFVEIMQAIKNMGVDVLSIEDSKAKGKTAAAIREGGFPGSIGLGVFDVHSPRIPEVYEMLQIPTSLDMDPKRIWINPDCGLKTRRPNEAYSQLKNMVDTAQRLRQMISR